MIAFSRCRYLCFVTIAFVNFDVVFCCTPTCGLLGWTPWGPCTSNGNRFRDMMLCCPPNLRVQTLEECLKVCNLSTAATVSKQNCSYIPTKSQNTITDGSLILTDTVSSTASVEIVTENSEISTKNLNLTTGVSDEIPAINLFTATVASQNKTLVAVTSTQDTSSSTTSEVLPADTDSISTEPTEETDAFPTKTLQGSATSAFQEFGSTTRNSVGSSKTSSRTVSNAGISRTKGATTSSGTGANGSSKLSGNNTAVVQEKSGSNGGVIAGAIVGVLALAGLSGLLMFFLYRRWKKKKEESKVEPEEKGDPNPAVNPNQQKGAPVSA